MHAFLHAFIIVALSQYFLSLPQSATVNAFVIGVTAGQIVSVVSNVRLLLECRSWNWFIFSAAGSSIFLLLKFVKFNPFGSRFVLYGSALTSSQKSTNQSEHALLIDGCSVVFNGGHYYNAGYG